MVDGFSSADPSLARGSQKPATSFKKMLKKAREKGEAKLKIIAPKYNVPKKSSSGGGGRSTLATPTPGASELTGTSQEREAQIAAFRSGGSSALAQERAKVETRVAEQKRIEQIRLDARALESHKEVQAKASQELARREAIRIEEFKESLALRGADVVSKTYDKSGTRTDLADKYKVDVDIKTQPYYGKRVVDTYTDEKTGRKIPITQTYYVDPTGIGEQVERKVTEEERKKFEKETAEVVIPEKKSFIKKKFETIADTYAKTESRTSEFMTKPIATEIGIGFEKIGFPSTFEEARINIQETTKYLESGGVPSWYAKTGEFISGVGVGTAQDVIDKPLKNIVLFGVGYGIGAGVEGASLGASAIGVKTAKVTSTAINVAGISLGGMFAYDVGKRIVEAPTSLEKGEAFGVAGKDIFLLGLGASSGKAGATKVYDILRTRKAVEVDPLNLGLKSIPEVLSGKDKFVESKHFGYAGKTGIDKQLFDIKIFEKAGRSYHATPTKFWKTQFATTRGTSEFPGLYTAPSPSFYFLKAGETPTKLLGLYEGGSRPALARIYGEGFSLKQNVVGKGFVTGVKPEIEAVFPVGSEFVKIGTETYFKFGGRRIPIDTFEYVKGGMEGEKISVADISGKYSSYLGEKSAVTPDAFLSSGSSVTKNSYTSPTYSSYSPSVIKPSYVSPSSDISYKPSSSAKRYKPSSIMPSYKIPSIITSYKPSYKSPIALTSYRPSKKRTIFNSVFSTAKRPFRFRFKQLTRTQSSYGVQVRRGGTFKSLGVYSDLSKAFSRGIERTAGTLAATFKITGYKPQLKTPKGFYKKITKKGETVFIEKKERRLSKAGEIKEIQLAKKIKKRRKKK